MNFKTKKVLLSIVFSCRNDNYPNKNGINTLEFCINDLIYNLKKINLFFEIVVVEYNPS